MSCFSCYSEHEAVHKKSFKNNIFISFLNSDNKLKPDCLICKESVENVVIYCNLCKVSLGHKECVITWLIRRNTCPSCNKILEL